MEYLFYISSFKISGFHDEFPNYNTNTIHAAINPETIPPPFEVLSLTFAIFLILIVLNNFF
jgi:hypothetical protein